MFLKKILCFLLFRSTENQHWKFVLQGEEFSKSDQVLSHGAGPGS